LAEVWQKHRAADGEPTTSHRRHGRGSVFFDARVERAGRIEPTKNALRKS
jgi:hypothetical protein